MKKGKIYLIPTTLGESLPESVIPHDVLALLSRLNYFIVEDLRSARRYLKKVDRSINIDVLTFFELNKYTSDKEVYSFLLPASKGEDIGIISEAGCPGVADPGADIVKLAHEQNIRVIPLVGPSSILMALMASGMNGQNFAFTGYLPIKKPERVKRIAMLEKRSAAENQTQLFIEAPYRNMPLLNDIVNTCNPQTRLCIACDITLDSEYIATKTIGQWKKKLPDIQKRPAIFLLHKQR